MHRWVDSRWTLPALSGLVLGTAYYAPLLVPLLVAFVPLLYWIDRHAAEPRHRRFASLFVFTLIAAIIGTHFCWAMLDFSWLAGLLWVGFAALLALKLSAVLLLASWLRRRTGWSWGVLLPLCWVPPDWLQTFGDLRMTGDHFAHSMAAYPFLIQFADVVGHYGVSAFVFVVNGLVYDAWLADRAGLRRRAALSLAALLAVVLAYDAWRWYAPRPAAGTIRVALVQPDVELRVKRGIDTEEAQAERLVAMTREAAELSPDVIVWPESAWPYGLFHWLERPETYALPEVQSLARELDVAILTGIEYYRVRSREDYEVYNAAVFVDQRGELSADWAAKVYLVPFVEATPFRGLLGPLVEGRGGEWDWLAGSFRPGPRGQVLAIDGSRAGMLVCYEQLFPDLTRDLKRAGAEYQVVITNDAWFGRTPFQQLLANAPRLRAIETRSSFVRVANTGVSGFVDRLGRYHERTGLFEQAIAVHDVERDARPTFYSRTGDWVVALLCAGLALAILRARVGGAAASRRA